MKKPANKTKKGPLHKDPKDFRTNPRKKSNKVPQGKRTKIDTEDLPV